jgi:acyl-coenzyme A synthetase/AMP-(fatty) acid ligase
MLVAIGLKKHSYCNTMANKYDQGLQVNPGEIEEVLRKHPGVADAAIVGIKDDSAGERPLAFVITTNLITTSDDRWRLIKELDESVKSRLHESYWLRKQIWFVDELPRNQSGKVLKKALREKVQQYSLGSVKRDPTILLA